MECFFVHLDSNPVPKAVENAECAFQFAEDHLRSEDEEDDSRWAIRWRRDDLYPDNFSAYSYCDLKKELSTNGTVVLQLVKQQQDGTSLLGETARIHTADKEKELQDEAELALGSLREKIEIHGEGISSKRRNVRSRGRTK